MNIPVFFSRYSITKCMKFMFYSSMNISELSSGSKQQNAFKCFIIKVFWYWSLLLFIYRYRILFIFKIRYSPLFRTIFFISHLFFHPKQTWSLHNSFFSYPTLTLPGNFLSYPNLIITITGNFLSYPNYNGYLPKLS